MTVKTTAQTAPHISQPPEETTPAFMWERITGTVFPTSIIHPARSSRSASWRMLYNINSIEKKNERRQKISSMLYDLKSGVHETTEYLERFLRNLLLDEKMSYTIEQCI